MPSFPSQGFGIAGPLPADPGAGGIAGGLAGVLNIAAAIECELGNLELAAGLATEALALAETNGAANEVVLAHASLARVAAGRSDRPAVDRSVQALQTVLEAPAGFSARAALAAANAVVDTTRAPASQPDSVH